MIEVGSTVKLTCDLVLGLGNRGINSGEFIISKGTIGQIIDLSAQKFFDIKFKLSDNFSVDIALTEDYFEEIINKKTKMEIINDQSN